MPTPFFELGTTLVSRAAYSLLSRAGVSAAELLDEHTNLIPKHAQALDFAERLTAIFDQGQVTTRFRVGLFHPLPHVVEVLAITHAGHQLTYLLLPHEL
jgi:hypothetical protein